MIVQLLLGAIFMQSNPLSTADIAARAILAQQTEDGAITMGKVGRAESSVVSYFACYAAQGLMRVYGKAHDRRVLLAAERWADWYAAHQNPDGTVYDYKGKSGSWTSTQHYDSSDSYAAVYLELMRDIWHLTHDLPWLQGRRKALNLAISGIRLTLQGCGLTMAKPDYPVMYTMDNVETLDGLRSAAELVSALGDTAGMEKLRSQADKMERAITELEWDAKTSSYRAAIQVDGGKMEGLSKWYPDIMANLMAVAWLPASPRNQTLFARLRRDFGADIPVAVRDQNDLERLVWWGLAAEGASDRPLLLTIRHRLVGFEAVCKDGCDAGLLGHVARLTVGGE